MNTLEWKFDYKGKWEANSVCRPGCRYRILVCDDGTFDVSSSDPELGVKLPTQPTLGFAKMECEFREGWLQIESKHLAALALASPLPLGPTDEEFAADEEISHDSNGTA